MSIRMKMLSGVSGNAADVGPSDTTVVYDLWATTRAERDDPGYFELLVNYVLDNAPVVILGNQFRKNFRWREDDDTGHFLFDVLFSSLELSESDLKWSYDTMGGTIKISTSRATQSYPAGGPNHQNAIQVDDDGDVQGTEVVIPALKLSCKKKFARNSPIYGPDTFMAFIKTMSSHTGKTNSGPYLTFADQELLFLGSTGQYEEGKENEVEYHFAASLNATGLTIGAITGIAKKGHDFIWIAYRHNLTASQRSRRPAFAYVERVYDSFSFSNLFG